MKLTVTSEKCLLVGHEPCVCKSPHYEDQEKNNNRTNNSRVNQGIGRMTHLLAWRDAFQKEAEDSIGTPNTKACSACGKDFFPRMKAVNALIGH